MSQQNDITRKAGFALMGSMCVLAALLQWKGLLYTPRLPAKVASVVEYTKPDGTIVHRTSIEGHAAVVRWYTVVPIAAVFVVGAALVSFIKPSRS